MASSGKESAMFWLVAQYLNQFCHRVRPEYDVQVQVLEQDIWY
jgi:hypothetical protein